MIKNIRYALYLIVLIGFSVATSGSCDAFFAAVKYEDAQTVTSLLQRGFDPNTLSPQTEHALILALREGSLKTVGASSFT